MLTGTDQHRQVEAAQAALEEGLDVWLQSHQPDATPAATLDHLAGVATTAEVLREQYPGRVTLVVGNEFSLFTRGLVPGPSVFLRLQLLLRLPRLFVRRANTRLGTMLARARETARRHFGGPVTYAAASWEQVDWSDFDVAGVNLYWHGTELAAYEQRLRTLTREAGVGLVVTEFGCGAHVGAQRRGAGAFRIVNWFATPPRVRPGHIRDERVQAEYLSDLIALYRRVGVRGCFVFTFAMRDFPHRADDPRHDLDMAGFGVVSAPPDDPTRWEPKEGFHAVAQAYGCSGPSS